MGTAQQAIIADIRTPSWLSRRELALTIIVISVAYLVLIWLLPADTFYVGDQGTKWLQIENLALKGWSDLSLDYPGRAFDPENRFVPLIWGCFEQDGKIYQKYSIAYAFIGSLFYNALGAVGVPLFSALSGLGTVIFTYLLGLRLSLPRPLAGLAAVTLGLATPLLFYSVDLGESVPNVFIVTLSIWLSVLALQRHSPGLWLTSGCLAGVSVWFRPEIYLLPAAVCLAYIVTTNPRGLKNLALYIAGVALLVIPYWIFQQRQYGHFLGPHLADALARGHLSINPYTAAQEFLRPDTLVAFLKLRGFFLALLYPWENQLWVTIGALPIVTWALSRILPKHYRVHVQSVSVLISLAVVVALVVQNLRTLYTPIDIARSFPLSMFALTLLIPCSETRACPLNRSGRFIALICLLFSLAVCFFGLVRGGTQWGPRLLLPIFPPFVLLVLHALHRILLTRSLPLARTALIAAFVVLLVLSIATQAEGIGRLFLTKQYYAQMAQIVLSDPGEVVIADHPWAIQAIASVFRHKPMFLVSQQGDLDALLALLASQGVREFLCISVQRNGEDEVEHPLLFHPQLTERQRYNLELIASPKLREQIQRFGLWPSIQRIAANRASIYIISSCELASPSASMRQN